MKPTLVVMAAGTGNRYGGLKQVEPVGPNGETLIDYTIYDAVRAGFGKLVFVIQKDWAEIFKQKISGKFERCLDVCYTYQEINSCLDGFKLSRNRRKPWGTGHAVLTAGQAVKEPFAVITADDSYGHNAFKIIADYLSSAQMLGCDNHAMVGYVLRNTLSEHGYVSRAVCQCSPQMLLDSIVERTKISPAAEAPVYVEQSGKTFPLTGDEIVSMNFWGFQPSIFDSLQSQFNEFLGRCGDDPETEFFLPAAINNLIAADKIRVKVLKTADHWFGITYRRDRISAVKNISKLIEEGIYPEKLW